MLSAPELAAYETAVAAAGQDVLGDIITAVVHHCRGYIADNSSNQLADGVTLPDRVIRSATHLIRKDLLTRLDLEVSEDRRKDASEALRFFEQVAAGKVKIEQPTGTIEDSGATQKIKVISTHDRQATRDSLKGL